MLVQQGFQFRLRRLRGAQERELVRWMGCARKVYNLALAAETALYEAGGKYPGYKGFCEMLTGFKEQYPYLEDPYSQVLQQSLKDLHRGFVNYFEGRAEKPTPKKKWRNDSIRIPQNFEVDAINGRVFIPKLASQCSDGKKCEKLGWLRFRMSRPIMGIPRNITIRRKSGKWYVSIQTQMEALSPIHIHANDAVGVDMGVVRFATLSDGSFLEPLSSFKRLERRLAVAQQKLSRCVKYSSNWKKHCARVSQLHIRIANARRDYLHKHSTTIANNHGYVVMEDLQVKEMSKSAKGTVETPGKNVKAKSELNKAILDQGWYSFRLMLEYKLGWRGGKLILVPPQNTSRQCLCCGYTDKGNRPSQAQFRCLVCGFEENADVVGAVNILRRGLPHIPQTTREGYSLVKPLLAPAETQRAGHAQLPVAA